VAEVYVCLPELQVINPAWNFPRLFTFYELQAERNWRTLLLRTTRFITAEGNLVQQKFRRKKSRLEKRAKFHKSHARPGFFHNCSARAQLCQIDKRLAIHSFHHHFATCFFSHSAQVRTNSVRANDLFMRRKKRTPFFTALFALHSCGSTRAGRLFNIQVKMLLGVGATPVNIFHPGLLCIADTQVNRHRSRVHMNIYTLCMPHSRCCMAPENFTLKLFGTREIAAAETAESVVQF
jgi:hypothetical protein